MTIARSTHYLVFLIFFNTAAATVENRGRERSAGRTGFAESKVASNIEQGLV